MKIFEKIRNCARLFCDKKYRFEVFLWSGFFDKMEDEKFLKKAYKIYLDKELNLVNPQTFNEKLQWLKLYDRKAHYPLMVDKVEAKKYVADILGDEYIIPTLGVWSRFDDINFDILPKKFVLKCTHDSGDPIICRDKEKLDLSQARKKLENSLKRNYFYQAREWPYKDLEPRIIAEKYMYDNENDNENLTDYKFFCFNGIPKFIYTVRDREKGHEGALHRFYDLNWNLQDLDLDHRGELNEPEPKPEQLENMIEIASILSRETKYLRVDLYLSNNRIYFGEMTFFPRAGWDVFDPVEWDAKLGAYINLEE